MFLREMLVCICLPVYTTLKPRSTLSSSKMWAECNEFGAFALEFVNAKFWCALLRRFGYLFCLFLTMNKRECLLTGSLTVADRASIIFALIWLFSKVIQFSSFDNTPLLCYIYRGWWAYGTRTQNGKRETSYLSCRVMRERLVNNFTNNL
jgi:hypothetical protein